MKRKIQFTQNSFVKMHGTGNSFILIKDFGQQEEVFKKLGQRLCDYNFGIGADGLLVISNAKPQQQKNITTLQKPVHYMRIFNKDGSKANMCGNGLRCFSACLVHFQLQNQNEFIVKTDDGIKKAKVAKAQKVYKVSIEMGKINMQHDIKDMTSKIKQFVPSLQFNTAEFIDFNVPHLVIYVQSMPTSQQICQFAKIIQNHINSNVNFVKVMENEQKRQREQLQIYVRTFERGAGLTLACGSGSCASAIVGVQKHKFFQKHQEDKTNNENHQVIRVITEGGVLTITIAKRLQNKQVIMDGPAEFICSGTFE